MSTTKKLSAVATAIVGLSFTVVGLVSHDAAQATTAVRVDDANPTITITNEGVNYGFNPAQLNAKVGQAITITNQDQNGVHSVTAKDHSFNIDVPPASSVTLKVTKAGNYPYYCQYHTDAHNPASLTVS